MDKPRSHVRKQQSVHWHFIVTLSRSDFEGKCCSRICLWEDRDGKRHSVYVWHGPLKSQLGFLCENLQMNCGQVGSGQFWPKASISHRRKEKILFMVLRLCILSKKQSVSTFCTSSKINTEHLKWIFWDKILHCYYLAEVYFVLLPSKIVIISIKTVTIYKYFSISLDKTISFWEPSIWDKCTDYNLNVNYK